MQRALQGQVHFHGFFDDGFHRNVELFSPETPCSRDTAMSKWDGWAEPAVVESDGPTFLTGAEAFFSLFFHGRG